MIEPAVHIEGLGKRYRLGLTNADTIADWVADFSRGLRRIFTRAGSPLGNASEKSENYFWALKDVSFDVRQGEVFGIVGRNGAGKSTLLKLISRVTSPTTGRIDICGRVASLLEVGTGFHPDLTGRENVYMNGTLLGMTRHEVNQRFDEIVEFASIGNFLDTQVKRYSSGMRVRLGFAVAAHLEPEILIIDEVLTVGDAEFQKKCLGKMQTVASRGRTVLFVSHNLGAVRNLCTRACLLEHGTLAMIGTTGEVVDHYLRGQGQQHSWIKRFRSTETIDFDGISVLRPISFAACLVDGRDVGVFGTDQGIELRFLFIPMSFISGTRIGVMVRNIDGIPIFGSNAIIDEKLANSSTQQVQVSCVIPSHLLNRGTYVVDLGVDCLSRQPDQYLDPESLRFDVADVEGHGVASESLPGVIRPKLAWRQSLRQGGE